MTYKLIIKADGHEISKRYGSKEALQEEAKRLRKQYKSMQTFSKYTVSVSQVKRG